MTSPANSTIVVDTNIVSYIYRKDPVATPYMSEMRGCALSYRSKLMMRFCTALSAATEASDALANCWTMSTQPTI